MLRAACVPRDNAAKGKPPRRQPPSPLLPELATPPALSSLALTASPSLLSSPPLPPSFQHTTTTTTPPDPTSRPRWRCRFQGCADSLCAGPMSTLSLQPVSFATETSQSSVQMLKTSAAAACGSKLNHSPRTLLRTTPFKNQSGSWMPIQNFFLMKKVRREGA